MSSTLVLFTFGGGVCLTSHLKCIYQLHACCCFKHYLKRSTGICGLGNRVMVTPWGPWRFRTCQVTRAQLPPVGTSSSLQQRTETTRGAGRAACDGRGPGCSQCQENQAGLQPLAGGYGHSPGTQLFLGERCRWPETDGIWGVVSE